jgi:hypothetical protein
MVPGRRTSSIAIPKLMVTTSSVGVDLVTRCESQGAGWSGWLVADFQHYRTVY